jgi:hypothetical protein
MRNDDPSFPWTPAGPMLLLLIVPVIWAVALVLVAGLCFTAKIGDSELSAHAVGKRGKSPAPAALRAGVPAGTERARRADGARDLAA